MTQAAVRDAEVAEDDQRTIARLEYELAREKNRTKFWQDKIGSIVELDAAVAISVQENVILNQRAQLRQVNEALWRRKEATRKLRAKYEALAERARQVDTEWYDRFTGKSGR